MTRIIVVGAGINGVTAAIELKNRGHEVVLVDPGPLPHSLAASTDISKAVRADYGPDEDYAELAERSIALWRRWNQELGSQLYHEVGCLFLRHQPTEPGDFEFESVRVLEKRGHPIERLSSDDLRKRFPAFSAEYFQQGFLDREAGYVESGRVVATLVERAKSLGVELRERAKFAALDEKGGRVKGIMLDRSVGDAVSVPREGPSRTGINSFPYKETLAADAVVMATGAWTPDILPFTKKFFRATGHPVFHFQPRNPERFLPERFPFFGADIATTGYYGFPLNQGVVKIASHGPGREMSPDSPERAVTAEEETEAREFLRSTIPTLAEAPLVFTRICLYCDTHDGDFWIASDPERPGLSIATGDSGHGFKFAPVLGEIIADAVEEKENRWLQKFRWRPEIQPGLTKEAARFSG